MLGNLKWFLYVDACLFNILMEFALCVTGGMASLIICLLVKLQHWRDERSRKGLESVSKRDRYDIVIV